MTITRRQLDSEYAEWFRGMRHAEEAKREILELFGTEPDEDPPGQNRIFTCSHGRSSIAGIVIILIKTDLNVH